MSENPFEPPADDQFLATSQEPDEPRTFAHRFMMAMATAIIILGLLTGLGVIG